MPDLSHKAVHDFWKTYNDPTIYRVIAFMESMEDWTADGHENLENKLKELGTVLDDVGNIDLQQEANMVQLVAHLKTGRGLRLLMSLDTAYPGAASKVLMKAEETTKSETDIPGIFLRRNIVFERLRLLSRIFSPERFKLILQVLEGTQDDS